LEFFRDIAMASLHLASLGRRRLLASAPFACSTVEDHVPILAIAGVDMLEIHVSFGLSA
jgi:hypothetical protein